MGAPLRVPGISAIKALGSQDYLSRALRPANSRLDSSKLMNTFGLRMPDWKIGVARAVRELVEASTDSPFQTIQKNIAAQADLAALNAKISIKKRPP